ncbi:MAG: competence/damage-inducible protein A [Eubacteriaceae bacterium]|nr:competence/damage-inducible protein A [Eubacteriaceae bacterium]
MNAAIICIGDEVLNGDVINTNAAFVSLELKKCGIDIMCHMTVGDDPSAIKKAIQAAQQKTDIIITTGGLGPTKDDLTKQAVCAAIGASLEFNQQIHNALLERYASRNTPMPQNNLSQCYIPKGATPLPNANGTAPGVYMEHNAKTYVMLPGPPREMEWMFHEYVSKELSAKTSKTVFEKCYMLSGIGESAAEELLRDTVAEDATYAFNTYLTYSGLMVKAVAKGKNEHEAKAILESKDFLVKAAIKEHLYSEEKAELWEVANRILLENGLTIASAESFTGGLFAELLTRTPGMSASFIGSIIAYTNAQKAKLLGVKEGILAKYGAVSSQTAYEMACGAREVFSSDIAVSFTGNAGPGESEGKSAGLAYIGINFKGKTLVEENNFRGDRDMVRARAANRAYHLLYGLAASEQLARLEKK